MVNYNKGVNNMTKEEKILVEKICKNVQSEFRSQVETAVHTMLSLQKKLEDSYDEYSQQPLSLTMTLGTGEPVTRPNPFVSEYRALFKDYMNAIINLKNLIEDVSVEEEINTLANIKEKIHLVK